jgi:hypothetical protein
MPLPFNSQWPYSFQYLKPSDTTIKFKKKKVMRVHVTVYYTPIF